MTAPPGKPLPPYDGYATADEFDKGYDNSITPEVVAHWEKIMREDSRLALLATPSLKSLRYGPGDRNQIDFFPARDVTGSAPLLIAIHGGLWFLFDKWAMHQLAPAFNAAGVHVACPNYGLAPKHSLGEIVDQCRKAAAFLLREAPDLEIDPAAISVLGHSAAGQLATLVASTTNGFAGPDGILRRLRSCIGVSGFYDIEPFFQTHFQAFTQFAKDDYQKWNPMRHVSTAFPPALLITGGHESSLLHQMAAHFAGALRDLAAPVETISAAHECHFSVLREIGNPASSLHARTLQLVKSGALSPLP